MGDKKILRLWLLGKPLRHLLVSSCGLLLGSGVKSAVSTAFGITETLSLGTRALRTVFSFPTEEVAFISNGNE